ncbi:hypothetical protein GCM10009716_42410 [Streptomyces sodiiphilus]|uniref:Uncharacterized protein n=1 Tax=Streptomyces sodiiphilus TaxID=226217 RepID=A0ABN2PRV0_9ACTN
MGLLLESWTQAAAVLACWDRPSPDVRSGLLVLLAAVRDTRLVAPVPEGAVVTHDVLVVRDLGNTFLVAGESTVDGSTVLEAGQVTLALRPAEQVPGAGPATIPADEPSAEREGP